MIKQTQVMLYVTNVETNRDFWVHDFGAKLVGEAPLPDGAKQVTLAVNAGLQLVLFPLDFIKKYSPEVAANVPSLLFEVDDVHALHDRLPGAGEIERVGDQLTFNFADPDGHYFAVTQAQ